MTNSEKPAFTAKFPHAPEVEWYFDYQCDEYCCTDRLDVGDNPVDMAVASAIHVASHALARGCGLTEVAERLECIYYVALIASLREEGETRRALGLYGQGLLLVANDLYGYAGL